jgi:hypothetical protein
MVYGRGTKDPHSAMLGGHSTLNRVVLGEGMSKYQIPPTPATVVARERGSRAGKEWAARRAGAGGGAVARARRSE